MVNPKLDNPHDRFLNPSVLPKWVQKAGVVLFVVLIALSGVYSLTEHWRRATFSLGVAMVWLAVLRFSCDSRILGVLAVRSRLFDVLFSLTTGVLLLFLSYSVDALGS